MSIVCRVCLHEHRGRQTHGEKIGPLPQTNEELADHLEGVHHRIVPREGETVEEAIVRIRAKFGPCAECDAALAQGGTLTQ